ncbi:NADAR family protein [Sphingomonas sp. 3-13AW]|uniref:NADAR family protein n=1 Tax=Sphingomonas sp. 3-13AW TaxID=3050450 RepID=UPI003BB62C7D
MSKTFDLTVPAARLWPKATTAAWCKVADANGHLSNMANGERLVIERVRDGHVVETIVFPSGEHLFQWLAFGHLPEHQARILAAPHAMQSKMTAYERLKERRADWRQVNVKAMAFTQTARLQGNRYRAALAATMGRDIAELSMRDAFWGAKPQGSSGDLFGQNVVGWLQTQLREGAREWQFDDLHVSRALVGDLPPPPAPPAQGSLLLGSVPMGVRRKVR